MQINIRSLCLVTALAALLAWMYANGWFSDYERRNLEIAEKLQQPVFIEFRNWTVADLASHVVDEYEIDVTVSKSDRTKPLDDIYYPTVIRGEVTLQNYLVVALYPADLTIVIRNGRLEFVDDNPNVEWQLVAD